MICPENFDRMISRFRDIQITSLEELRVLVRLVLNKALAEPHYLETHAKLVCCLEDMYPEFSPLPGSRSGRPQTFMTLFKDAVQEEFETTLCMLAADGNRQSGHALQASGKILSVQISPTDSGLVANATYMSSKMAFPSVELPAGSQVSALAALIQQKLGWIGVSLVDATSLMELQSSRPLCADLEIVAKELHDPRSRVARAISNMKLIGNLFLWKLLPNKIVCEAASELTADTATESMLECACELLQAAGHTLDNDTAGGKAFVSDLIHRLDERKKSCSKRVEVIIRNVKDLRTNEWQLKLLRDEAKTKREVKQDSEDDARRGLNVVFATRVVGA